MLSIVTLCILFLGFLGGCASQTSPTMTAEAQEYQRTAEQIFTDDLDLFIPRDKDESAIKTILTKLKEAYATCDKTSLVSLFSEDYAQAVLTPRSSPMIISRREYFRGLGMEKPNEADCKRLERRLSMAEIRVVQQAKPADTIKVVLLTTYASKYFNPRFMETFIFRQRKGKMTVDKRVIAPLHPKSAKFYQAELYVTDMSEFEKHKLNLQQMAWEDGDIFIDRILREGTYQMLPIDYNPRSVVLLFREPPPPGSKVKIAHSYYNSRGNLQSSFEENHSVEGVNPWFFLVTRSTIFAEGNVTYAAYLDGTKVLKRSYSTQ